MRNVELQERTKKFALRVIKMVSALPRNMTTDVLGRQTLRSGTSVAANYREACRARSKAEMISKLAQVEQELDETLLWWELLVESQLVPSARMGDLQQEAEELLRIVVASIKTLKAKAAP
jgi:four helix bundle protein